MFYKLSDSMDEHPRRIQHSADIDYYIDEKCCSNILCKLSINVKLAPCDPGCAVHAL